MIDLQTIGFTAFEVVLAVFGCWTIYKALRLFDEPEEYVSQEGRYWAVRREWREGDDDEWRRRERR